MKTRVVKTISITLLALTFVLGLQACTVVKVVDAAASTTVGVAKGTAKVTGKVAGAAIPDGKDKGTSD